MTNTAINVVVGRRRPIRVTVDESAGLISTDRNSVVLKNATITGGGFTNGQSIQVNNFVINGTFTANGSPGQPYYFLKTNGNTTYWSYGPDFPTGDYGVAEPLFDALGVRVFDYSYDCNDDGPLFVKDLETIL